MCNMCKNCVFGFLNSQINLFVCFENFYNPLIQPFEKIECNKFKLYVKTQNFRYIQENLWSSEEFEQSY